MKITVFIYSTKLTFCSSYNPPIYLKTEDLFLGKQCLQKPIKRKCFSC